MTHSRDGDLRDGLRSGRSLSNGDLSGLRLLDGGGDGGSDVRHYEG